MRIVRFVFVSLVAVGLASPVALSASDEAVAAKTAQRTAPAGTFAALEHVKASPMSAGELEAVQGQHVHFVTLKNGKLHLAGNPFEHNWSNEWGGSDGEAVAPSYKGLCTSHGNGSIFIPTGPPGTPVTLQCGRVLIPRR
jgi:hypothetical protein